MFKIHHNDAPCVLQEFFTKNNEINEYDTRSANHLHVSKCITNLTALGIRYEGVVVWNKILKAEINPDNSEVSFKNCGKCFSYKLFSMVCRIIDYLP